MCYQGLLANVWIFRMCMANEFFFLSRWSKNDWLSWWNDWLSYSNHKDRSGMSLIRLLRHRLWNIYTNWQYPNLDSMNDSMNDDIPNPVKKVFVVLFEIGLNGLNIWFSSEVFWSPFQNFALHLIWRRFKNYYQ